MSSSRIPSLDGLRAVSILLVLLGHLHGTGGFPIADLRFWLGDHARLGVDIFFVISGFLITSLLLEEKQATGRISLRYFYVRRALRILPAFLAFMAALLVALRLGWVELTDQDLLFAFTYTVNYDLHRSWPIGHLWSLSVEEQFYLLWPLALKTLGTRRGTIAAAGAFFLAPIVRGSMRVAFHTPVRDLEVFPAVADGLAVGCLLAACRPWLLAQPWYVRLTASRWMAVAPVLIIVLNRWQGYTVGTVFGAPVLLVTVAVSLDACIRHSSSWVGRVLNWWPFVTVGVLSYSLYLWQQVFLNRNSTAWATAFPANVVAVLVAASLSYYALERPLLRLRRRYSQTSASGMHP